MPRLICVFVIHKTEERPHGECELLNIFSCNVEMNLASKSTRDDKKYYYLTKTYGVGTQKNSLNEMFILFTLRI